MKRGMARILVLSLLAALMISIFAVVSVQAAPNNPGDPDFVGPPAPANKQSPLAQLLGGASSGFQKTFTYLFGQVHQGQSILELAGVKFLFFILLILILFPLIEMLGFTRKHQAITWIIAIIVAFLSTFYIAPESFYGILQSYAALGITLTSIIPFAIILAFAWSMSTEPSPAKLLIQRLVLIFFAAFLIYRLVLIWVYPTTLPTPVWEWAGILYTVTLVAVAITLILYRKLLGLLLTQKVKGYIDQSKVMSKADATATYMDLNEKIRAITANGFGPDDPFIQTLTKARDAIKKYAEHAD